MAGDYEQYYEQPYRCQDSQNRTVGYGHVITKNDGTKYDNGISKDDALTLLRGDLNKAVGYVNNFSLKNSVPLSQHQFDSIVSFTFNAGQSWINKSGLREKLVNG